MTIQVQSRAHGASKAALQAALTANPAGVWFYDPSIMAPRSFTGADMAPGEKFPVVMDHPKLQRFATVARLPGGGFRVG